MANVMVVTAYIASDDLSFAKAIPFTFSEF